MARGTKEQKQAADIGSDFPYRHLMKHPAWSVIDSALAELEANKDIELQTARRYVIGSLVEQLVENGLALPALSVRSVFPRDKHEVKINAVAFDNRPHKKIQAAR